VPYREDSANANTTCTRSNVSGPLRFAANGAKGAKVILAWEKNGIDFAFWHKVKQSSGLYFIRNQN
jgi:hypothetical protein